MLLPLVRIEQPPRMTDRSLKLVGKVLSLGL